MANGARHAAEWRARLEEWLPHARESLSSIWDDQPSRWCGIGVVLFLWLTLATAAPSFLLLAVAAGAGVRLRRNRRAAAAAATVDDDWF